MGEVGVLQPQDILKNRFNQRHHRTNLIQPPMKSRKAPTNLVTSNPNRSSNPAKASRRKRSPVNSRDSSGSPSKEEDSKNLVLGKVKILKRGESLTDVTTSLLIKTKEESKVSVAAPASEDLAVPTSDGLLGPVPKTISERMEIYDFYAGSAFFTSPPPSSLPLPAFCKKKSLQTNDVAGDLRRILRLDL